RLWKRGAWQVLRCDTTAPGPSTLRRFWTLARPLFAARSEAEAEFLGDVCDAAACLGMLDARLLLLRGKAVGCQIDVGAPGGRECIAATMNWAVGDDVSTVLVGKMVADGMEHGDRRFTFGPRTQPWAAGWPAVERHHSRWTHFASFSPRAQ